MWFRLVSSKSKIDLKLHICIYFFFYRSFFFILCSNICQLQTAYIPPIRPHVRKCSIYNYPKISGDFAVFSPVLFLLPALKGLFSFSTDEIRTLKILHVSSPSNFASCILLSFSFADSFLFALRRGVVSMIYDSLH